MHEISLKAMSSWLFSNMISDYIANPNPDFIGSFRHQMTEVVQDEDDPSQYRLETNDGTSYDLFNNQFTDDGRLVCDKIEASGNTAVADKDLVNNRKTMWYLSI